MIVLVFGGRSKYDVDFLKVTRETHSIAIEERPFSKHGTEVLNILGNEYNLCLKRKKSAENALNDAHNKITALEQDGRSQNMQYLNPGIFKNIYISKNSQFKINLINISEKSC